MDLSHALRSTPATRAFTDRALDDEMIASILDDARVAPNGGNRQAWRVVLLRDPQLKVLARELYDEQMPLYLAQAAAGLTPFNVFNDRAEEDAVLRAAEGATGEAPPRGGFDRPLDEAPALLAVLADLSALATVDRDLGRYGLAGGASIYPFCWSILLAARARGLGGVMTTMNQRAERPLLDRLGAGPEMALASLIVLGEPRHEVRRLRRQPVSSFASIDRLGGPALGA